MANLKGKTIFISGASRGIGRAIALRCAQDGANIVIVAKTATPHPKLEGTIHSVAEEVIAAGGKALPLQVDIRYEEQIQAAVEQTVATFGGLDILVNNASAISLTPTLATEMKRFDLMFGVNVRGTFACAKACLPYLTKANPGHILTLSPPMNMDAKWFKYYLAYTMSKYGMSMCTLGLAAEQKANGVLVNSLWPCTTIATAAIEVHFPEKMIKASRKPEIMADAAYAILSNDNADNTGHFYLDEEVLKANGISDFSAYAVSPGHQLHPDLYID